MPRFRVDIKLDNLEVSADNRVEAMFWAKEMLSEFFWPYISNMASSMAPESKEAYKMEAKLKHYLEVTPVEIPKEETEFEKQERLEKREETIAEMEEKLKQLEWAL